MQLRLSRHGWLLIALGAVSLSASGCFNKSESEPSGDAVTTGCVPNGELCQTDDDCCSKSCAEQTRECVLPGTEASSP